MRASIILTSFFIGLSAAAPSSIDVARNGVSDDGFDFDPLATSLDKRQDNRINFRLAGAAAGIAGYTLIDNGEGLKKVIRNCQEYQGGNKVLLADCVVDALVLGLWYGVSGMTGYGAGHAAVATLLGSQGLANSINGDQGQGPSVKRAAMGELYLPYGSGNLSDTMVDSVNRVVDLALNPPAPAPKGDFSVQQQCPNNNANMFTKGHYWDFGAASGIKFICKSACGDNLGWDYNQLNGLFVGLAKELLGHMGSVTQFTVFRNSGHVMARCKLVFLQSLTDTCPEFVDGRGCNF